MGCAVANAYNDRGRRAVWEWTHWAGGGLNAEERIEIYNSLFDVYEMTERMNIPTTLLAKTV